MPMYTKCGKCNVEYEKHTKYGYCKPCKTIYLREYSLRKKKEMKIWLHNIGCFTCSENNPDCLEVHHLDSSTKRFGKRSQARLYQKKDVEDNLAVILCANCHLLFHSYFGGRNASFPPQTTNSVVDVISKQRSIGG